MMSNISGGRKRDITMYATVETVRSDIGKNSRGAGAEGL